MKKKEFLIILIISLGVILTWITTDFIRSRPQAPLKSNLTQLLSPLNPTFDQATIEEISQVPPISQSKLSNEVIAPTPTPTPSSPTKIIIASPSPQATTSALPLSITAATQSGIF